MIAPRRMRVMIVRVLGAAALLGLAAGIVGISIEQANERTLIRERERKIGALSWDRLPLHWAITTLGGTRGTSTWSLESGERFTGSRSRKELGRLLDEASAWDRKAGRS